MTPAALWTAVGITATAVLSFDLLLPPGVAGGVPYVLLVLLALKSPSRNAAIGLAAAGSVLTVLGFFLSEPGAMLSIVLTNRALALLVIWISVLPVVRYQRARFDKIVSRIDVEDIMNSLLEAVIISNERGIVLAANKSAEAMFGYGASSSGRAPPSYGLSPSEPTIRNKSKNSSEQDGRSSPVKAYA